MTISKLASRRYPAPSHGGRFAHGQPRVIVVHCTESPSEKGRAYSNAVYVASQGLSVHYFVDVAEIVAGLDEDWIGWGAGTVNSAAIHVEFCGYAKWQSNQWDTRMLDLGRRLIADIAARHGIPMRFTTDEQLREGFRGTGPGGITTHAQCTHVIGGTTHTDPGSGFPLPLLLSAPAKTPKPATPQKELTPLAQAQTRYKELLGHLNMSDDAGQHWYALVKAVSDAGSMSDTITAMDAVETTYTSTNRSYDRRAVLRIARAVMNVENAK